MSSLVQKDIRNLRTNLSKYIDKYTGKKIYITKYNKVIGELKFYSAKEKARAKLAIAKELISNSHINLDLS
ncbi:MAG: hypothetical protein ISS14_02010 [Actinobacteria bacterium]|nr:hypothetical protein [Actinomycetota bacterium]MBL7123647.1 hypothetical protein [Actinomycetota bacterium]